MSVLDNDEISDATRIVSFTQPEPGRVRISGDALVLTVPDDTERVAFVYTIGDDSERSSSANVTVVVQERDSALTEPVQEIALDEIPGEGRNYLPEIGIPEILVAILSIELPMLSMVSAVAVSLVVAFLIYSRRKRRGWVAISGTGRGSGAIGTSATSEDPVNDNVSAEETPSRFRFRHDTDAMWATGRRNRARTMIEVDSPNGPVWINNDDVSTT